MPAFLGFAAPPAPFFPFTFLSPTFEAPPSKPPARAGGCVPQEGARRTKYEDKATYPVIGGGVHPRGSRFIGQILPLLLFWAENGPLWIEQTSTPLQTQGEVEPVGMKQGWSCVWIPGGPPLSLGISCHSVRKPKQLGGETLWRRNETLPPSHIIVDQVTWQTGTCQPWESSWKGIHCSQSQHHSWHHRGEWRFVSKNNDWCYLKQVCLGEGIVTQG